MVAWCSHGSNGAASSLSISPLLMTRATTSRSNFYDIVMPSKCEARYSLASTHASHPTDGPHHEVENESNQSNQIESNRIIQSFTKIEIKIVHRVLMTFDECNRMTQYMYGGCFHGNGGGREDWRGCFGSIRLPTASYCYLEWMESSRGGPISHGNWPKPGPSRTIEAMTSRTRLLLLFL